MSGATNGLSFIPDGSTAPASGMAPSHQTPSGCDAVVHHPPYAAQALGDENEQIVCIVGPIPFDEFPFNGEVVRLDPPLEFSVVRNDREGAWEVFGEGLYASVFVYATDVRSAIDELKTDVLPFLWRQYALKDDTRLSRRARELKADLRRRECG